MGGNRGGFDVKFVKLMPLLYALVAAEQALQKTAATIPAGTLLHKHDFCAMSDVQMGDF